MHASITETIPVDLLLRAYRGGVFPMADHRNDREVYWVEPRERAIIPLDGFNLSRSLRKVIRRDQFRVSCDADFPAIIAACAHPREDDADSWISHQIEASYITLHHAGHAHSIEVWQGDRLAGGLYGVVFDRVFCGESMFSRADNASKVALAWLIAAMRKAGFMLLDCQFMTDHLASMGAVEIPQVEYLRLLAAARGRPKSSLPHSVASFSAAGAGLVGDLANGLADGSDRGASLPPSSPGKVIVQSLTQTS